ncbi:MAG TPA: hypothetical protein VF399_10890 [bacterium]
MHSTGDFGRELKIVANVAENTEERLSFMGTFFALQLLLINRQTIDTLRMDIIAAETNKVAVYRKFMRNVGDWFRTLTTAYINELLSVFLDRQQSTEFVILGVGTKSDQDDIDVGIIDDGGSERDNFNRAVAQISHEFMKYATSFHFHLSEHVGTQHYSASINEYKRVLKHEIRDFVIINEMLSAAVITGSGQLFDQYRTDITGRYFFKPGIDNKYHEGYLRGILGEIHSLIARPISSMHINFKEDGLRIIKSIVSAQKTVYRIDQVNAWDIIKELKIKNERRLNEYEALDRSLTFFEIFRYLYQLFVTQDEEVILDNTSMPNIRKIARVLGYSDIGQCLAEEHLLVHYYEHVQNIRKIVPVLLDDLKSHLAEHSDFAAMFNLDYKGNSAKDFVEKFKFYRGTSYWDDIIDRLKAENVLKRFVNDISSLSVIEQTRIIRKYIEWAKYDFYTLIKFLTILGSSKYGFSLFKNMNDYLLQKVDKITDLTRKLTFVFYRFPHLINNYFSLNEEQQLKRYQKTMKGQIYEEDIASVVSDLEYILNIHFYGSKFYKRYFHIVINKYPECIQILRRPPRLKEFGEWLHNDVGSMRTFRQKKQKLGEYYDFEMMRVGINTLHGASVATTSADFIEFSDRYIHSLVDICRQEVDAEYNKRIITEDVLAIFAAGGHAREQAYDDDYDIIVLLNSEDPDITAYCNKIVSRINAEIIQRGTIPHHRFADYFGRYVVLFQEMEKLLDRMAPEIFIEKSQILGARLIVGSRRLENEFVERIVKPKIFDKKEHYIAQMIQEIQARHVTEKEISTADSDIKEGMGGLRDIEMMMLIFKAYYGIKEPVNTKLFENIAGIQPVLRGDLETLSEAFIFLNGLRDIYRLTAGASDAIVADALGTASRVLGYANNVVLYEKFNETKKHVADTIPRLLQKIGYSSFTDSVCT